MDANSIDAPEQVVKFAPRQGSYELAVEEVGQQIVAKLEQAAELSNENCDRALALAHKLAMQLRSAEDRIKQLEAEIHLCRDRAARAEGWLQTIHKEIEDKLLARKPKRHIDDPTL